MLAVIRQFDDGMQACVRLDDGECSDTLDVGLRQGCVFAPLLFNMFFTAVLRVAEKRFLADAAITDYMVQLQKKGERREERHFTHRQSRRAEGEGGGGAETVGYAVRGRCGHRIAITRRAGEDDDGDRDCVLAVRADGLRGENRDMCLQTKGGGKVPFTINTAGQVYKQTIEFVYLGGAITAGRP